MQNDPIGILILVVVAIAIVALRGKIHKSNNKTVQTLTKVGDFFIIVRAIIGLIMVSFLVFILAKGHKK